MKTETALFRKVFIDGKEENLPKESGEYLVLSNFGSKDRNPYERDFDKSSPASIIFWTKDIDWYLLPVESTLSDEEIKKEGIKYKALSFVPQIYECNLADWIKGAEWARDRMLPNNDMAELIKAYEKIEEARYALIMELSRRSCNIPSTPAERNLRSKISELWQEITELRNKLKL